MRKQKALLTLLSISCAACAAAHDDLSTTSGDNGLGTGSGGTTGGGGGGSGGSGGGSGSDGTGSGSDTGPHMDPVFPTTHPIIYLGTQRDRLKAALTAHTAAATRFSGDVDKWIGGADLWDFPAWHAALLSQLTGDAHYCTAAIAAVETQVSTAEATTSGGGSPDVARDSYLYSGEMIGNVMLTYDWCYDQVSTSQRTRWVAYADQTVWNIWHPDTAHWGSNVQPWSGWSVDNPSNNYYYSFLKATMLVGLATKGMNPNADTWISTFRTAKLGGELVPTFDADLVGGGSREGTGYGQSMRKLFELYDMWQATTGERIAELTPHTRASLLDYVHETMPTLDRTAPIGDHSRDSTSSYFDYDRHYLLELVALFPSDPLSARVKGMLEASSVPLMSQAFMGGYDFILDRPAIASTALTGLGTTYYASGTGVVSTRSGWDRNATWLGLIAGPYTESHAHQDQGSMMLFKNDWLSYDACHDTHSGVRQEIGEHSLVRIERDGNIVQQKSNTISHVLALHQGTGWVHVAADVTPAYTGVSDVSRVQREMVFLEPDTVVVYDRVASASGTTQNWALVSPLKPSISGSTASFTGLAVQRLAPANASSSVFDFAASDSDFRGGFRLDEAVPGGDVRFLHVMSTAGPVHATAIGDTGATIVLPDGRTAVVTFNRDAIGASLQLGGATTALGATIDPMPQ